ncbi:MAG: hypothetical protein HY051_00350 [Candidatus Aenigmarchaeota archaeon]|nr:hypothetical protein [Candidatus Aenigmarchaeota archaeon]
MSNTEDPIKPLREINVLGKGETKQPFPISGMKWKGLYYFIFVDDLQQLLKINETYKSIRKPKLLEPLREVRLVGGGNVVGYKPFLYKGRQCVCILVEHLKRLIKINREYRKLLRKGIRKRPRPRKIIEVKPKHTELIEKGLEAKKLNRRKRKYRRKLSLNL